MQVVQQPGYMAEMGQKPRMERLPHQSHINGKFVKGAMGLDVPSTYKGTDTSLKK